MLLLLAAACHQSSDLPAPESDGVYSATVLVAADLAQGTIELAYEFEPALPEFRFHYQANSVRDGSWDVLDPEFVLENDSVHRVDGGLFEHVRIGVNVDADWFDRVFPALRPVGDASFVFNTNYLMLEGLDLDSIRAEVIPGNVIAYSNFVSIADTADDRFQSLPVDSGHYVYFGQEELIQTFAGGVIVSNAASSSRILELLREGVEPAVEWLGSLLRIESVDRVHIIATVDEAGDDTRLRGDVSASGELFLRFFGRGWNGESGDLLRNAERSIYHELVHALTFFGFQVDDGEPEWLWEGLAEYLAVAYAGLHGITGDEDWFRAQVRQRTSECIDSLEEEGVGISHPSMLNGRDPYNCGVLVYWLLDGAPDAQGAGERLRVVWSSVAETFTADDAAYGVANLLAAGGATGAIEAQQLLEILIEGPGGSDWQDRDRLLSELGVRVTYEYGDTWGARARAAIVNHILRLRCTPGRIGFWTFEDHIRLDTGDRCGTLSGDPLVDRINGLSIFGGMQAVFDSVEAACRNDEPIQIGIFNSAESLSAECTEPLSMLPPSATLTVGYRN